MALKPFPQFLHHKHRLYYHQSQRQYACHQRSIPQIWQASYWFLLVLKPSPPLLHPRHRLCYHVSQKQYAFHQRNMPWRRLNHYGLSTNDILIIKGLIAPFMYIQFLNLGSFSHLWHSSWHCDSPYTSPFVGCIITCITFYTPIIVVLDLSRFTYPPAILL